MLLFIIEDIKYLPSCMWLIFSSFSSFRCLAVNFKRVQIFMPQFQSCFLPLVKYLVIILVSFLGQEYILCFHFDISFLIF